MSVDFQQLVGNLHQANKNFQSAWSRAGNGYGTPEPAAVSQAREVLWTALGIVFKQLEEFNADFEAGKTEAIDAILDFIEVDIPAFRCGYAKEEYYRKLKSLPLQVGHRQRLSNISIRMCASSTYRREFRDLARLMIKIADREFIDKIKLLIDDTSPLTAFKARLMSEMILQNRRDLR